MSNKTRLQTNNTNLQLLIDKANALPDAGSGGGASVETCTLVVEGSVMVLTGLIYQNALGEAVVINADPITPASGTYSAVCGSLVVIETTSYAGQPLCENMEMIAGSTKFLITAKAGETARLTVTQKT